MSVIVGFSAKTYDISPETWFNAHIPGLSSKCGDKPGFTNFVIFFNIVGKPNAQ